MGLPAPRARPSHLAHFQPGPQLPRRPRPLPAWPRPSRLAARPFPATTPPFPLAMLPPAPPSWPAQAPPPAGSSASSCSGFPPPRPANLRPPGGPARPSQPVGGGPSAARHRPLRHATLQSVLRGPAPLSWRLKAGHSVLHSREQEPRRRPAIWGPGRTRQAASGEGFPVLSNPRPREEARAPRPAHWANEAERRE